MRRLLLSIRMAALTAAHQHPSSSLCAVRAACSNSSSLFSLSPPWRKDHGDVGRHYRRHHRDSSGVERDNPRRARSRLAKALRSSAKAEEHFRSIAFATDDDSHQKGGGGISSSRTPRSLRQRRSHHVIQRVGREVCEKAKYMSDSEWESVPLADKHAFTQCMAAMLRDQPTQTTEQQRRRYFETSMVDPRELDPSRSVTDDYERLKMGLPTEVKHLQRQLGVSQAVYESSDASLFDAKKALELEGVMIQIKQQLAEFVQHRRAGTSTETERRRLAILMRDFHYETQKHLGNMFKYAEMKIREVTKKEKTAMLEQLAALKARKRQHASSSRKNKRSMRKKELNKFLSHVLGVHPDVAKALCTEMETQQKFMEFCEVFARLSLGKGFTHTKEDEGLDSYTDHMRRLYSVDASQLSTLDVVQYLAAKEGTPPVEWAKRWYERLLTVPLEQLPEYQRLESIRREDVAAMTQLKKEEGQQQQQQQEPEQNDKVDTGDAKAEAEESHQLSEAFRRSAAGIKKERVVHLVEKMFLPPTDPRLESLHEKRLRYIAYLQMEQQIEQARENAARFEGVEELPEAERCRALYQKLVARRQDTLTKGSSEEEGNKNLFHEDPEAARIFEEIQGIVAEVIHKAHTRQSTSARRLDEMKEKMAAVKEQLESSPGSVEAAALQSRKAKLAQRILSIAERDVQADLDWLSAMDEAERPPLLPVPERGMSYVSAADVQAWKEVREKNESNRYSQFAGSQKKEKGSFHASFLGQPWEIPDKPTLFWGTGVQAVQQALQVAVDEASMRRRGEDLPPPYPCAENPWGWRMAPDILDD